MTDQVDIDDGRLRDVVLLVVVAIVALAVHVAAPAWSLVAVGAAGLVTAAVIGRLHRSLQRERRELAEAHAELQHAVDHRAQVEREAAGLSSELIHARRFAAIGRLAGGLAHDFNNLLSAMTSNLVLAVDDLAESEVEEATEAVEDALCAARRASELARKLLALSRNEHVDLEVIDFAAELEGMVRMLETVAGPTVSLDVRRPEGPVLVEGDPIQLEQVVLNLVVNARDAMPHGGTIAIALRVDTRGVSLQVRDEGEGMDAATRTHLFEPFFTTKDDRGTGLGLSTCYDVVTHHRGSIAVLDSSPRGTIFEVLLPLARPATTERESVLLVVQDGAVQREWTRRLSAEGLCVVPVRTPREALEAIVEHEPQLVCCAADDDAEWLRLEAPGVPVLSMNPPRPPPDASGVIPKIPEGLAERVRSVFEAA